MVILELHSLNVVFQMNSLIELKRFFRANNHNFYEYYITKSAEK